MLFEKKTLDPQKIRVRDSKFNGFKWVMLRKGEQIELPEDHGFRHGLIPVKKKESKKSAVKKDPKNIKPNRVQPKLEKVNVTEKKRLEYYKEKLLAIIGFGKKTVKDLIQVYPTEEKLIKVIKSGKDIPIRDDLAKLIKKKFKVKSK